MGKRIKLCDEMVDVDGNGYYKVDILLTPENSNEGHTSIPGIGRVLVYKKLPQYSYQSASFAWYVKKESKS
jgi:hypothetical protein